LNTDLRLAISKALASSASSFVWLTLNLPRRKPLAFPPSPFKRASKPSRVASTFFTEALSIFIENPAK